jgi:ABC-type uncharacterized transport system YnjBCD ATPase subunit
VSWAASGFTPTFATTGGTSFTVTAGQVLTITGPSTADTTLANVSITLAGYIT